MKVVFSLFNVCSLKQCWAIEGLADGDCSEATPRKTGSTSLLWLQGPSELSHSGYCLVFEPKQLGHRTY